MAHDGKTRQELASELNHLEADNSSDKKNQDEASGIDIESTNTMEKSIVLDKMKSSPNFYVSSVLQLDNFEFFPHFFANWGDLLKKCGKIQNCLILLSIATFLS